MGIFSSVWRKARSKIFLFFSFYSIRGKWLSVYFLCCFFSLLSNVNDKNKLLMCLKKQKERKKMCNFKVNWHAWWSLFRVHTTVNIHLLCLHFTFNAFSTFTFHHHVFIEIILLMWKHAWWHGSCTFISTPTHIHFTSSILIVKLDGMLILTYTEKETHSIVFVLPFLLFKRLLLTMTSLKICSALSKVYKNLIKDSCLFGSFFIVFHAFTLI